MTAQQLFASSLFSGPHPAEPKLKWMVVLSGVVHLVAFAVIMGLPPSSSRNLYYSPTYSVDLVGLPPGGAPLAGGGGKASGKPAAAEVKKQHVKLWKGPSEITSQVKVQAGRKHPVLEIPAKEKKIAPQQSEPEPGESAAQGSAEEKPGTAGTQHQSQPGTAADTGEQSAGGGVPGPGPGGGGGGGAADLRFSGYYRSLYEKIYQSWILPDYVTEKEGSREVIVVIKIQRDGRILEANFEKASGNRLLDASVMNALKKADPLPPLPDDFRESFLEIGIRFIPQQKAQ
jgi:protein TonB